MSTLVLEFPGEAGAYPRLARLNATEFTYNQLTSTGFTNQIPNVNALMNGDYVFAKYNGGESLFLVSVNPSTGRHFTPFLNAHEVQLIEGAIPGITPKFANTEGDITDDFPSVLVSDKILHCSVSNADVSENLIFMETINVTSVFLAGGSSVSLFAPLEDTAYELIWARTIGTTNFSGGGGDRDISLNAGLTSLSVIPAATLAALQTEGYLWGAGASFPFSDFPAFQITFDNSLSIAYTGGMADYSAGAIKLQFLFRRVPL